MSSIFATLLTIHFDEWKKNWILKINLTFLLFSWVRSVIFFYLWAISVWHFTRLKKCNKFVTLLRTLSLLQSNFLTVHYQAFVTLTTRGGLAPRKKGHNGGGPPKIEGARGIFPISSYGQSTPADDSWSPTRGVNLKLDLKKKTKIQIYNFLNQAQFISIKF
jgi:hypothetical protein